MIASLKLPFTFNDVVNGKFPRTKDGYAAARGLVDREEVRVARSRAKIVSRLDRLATSGRIANHAFASNEYSIKNRPYATLLGNTAFEAKLVRLGDEQERIFQARKVLAGADKAQ